MEQWGRKAVHHVSTGLLAAAMAFTAPSEGIRLVAYQNPGDVPTICRGHTAGVHLGQHATQAQCDEWQAQDEGSAGQEVIRDIDVPMTQGQFVAFTDFVFNDGPGNFRKSSMRRLANANDMDGACRAFMLYDRRNHGLQDRHRRQMKLCLGEG